MIETKTTPNFIGFDHINEKQFDDHWRIYNGSVWTHSFSNANDALTMCKLWGGKAVAIAKYNTATDCCSYSQVRYP
jgi:hypothetical protein